MILLWGTLADLPIVAVASALQALKQPFFVVDARAALETELELLIDSGGPAGSVQVRGGERLALTDVSAVYARPPDPTRAPSVLQAGEGSAAYWHALGLHESLTAFTELTPALVVNKCSAMGSNASKPYQVALVERAGFKIPETLVTTDLDAVHAFRDRYPDVIYKSVSGVRSIVSRLTDDKMSRLDAVGNCPTQFQRYVPGVDFRVHVLGDRVFTARVESPVVDYRYAAREGKEIRMSAFTLSDAEEGRCRALARTLDLEMAGIDLRQTPEGEWYCFEVNPSPAFTFYELEGQNMAMCVAELLARGASSRSRL